MSVLGPLLVDASDVDDAEDTGEAGDTDQVLGARDRVVLVALALHLNCPLWTGDGKLLRGLRRKGFKLLMTNDDLRKELGA